jgi:hypothetical protein
MLRDFTLFLPSSVAAIAPPAKARKTATVDITLA